jgi:uncharacterized protein (DUF1778 family)
MRLLLNAKIPQNCLRLGCARRDVAPRSRLYAHFLESEREHQSVFGGDWRVYSQSIWKIYLTSTTFVADIVALNNARTFLKVQNAASGAGRSPAVMIPKTNLEKSGHWPYIVGRRTTMATPALNTSRGRVRGERLETRVTADQKSLIEHAAALQGRTVTDFVLTSVQEAARRAIEEHQRLDLSVRDSQAFVDALINPQPVNDRLRDTVQRYRRATGV